MFKNFHITIYTYLVFCSLFLTSCKKEKLQSVESNNSSQKQKIERSPIVNLPFKAAEKEQVDDYSKRFNLSQEQSVKLIGRENQLKLKLKTLSFDGSNGPELIAELTTYCDTLRNLLSNKSVRSQAKRISHLSAEFLNDIPKGQASEKFLAQLDSLKLDNIRDEYSFEVRAIMAIINSISQFRPDLLPDFLAQQGVIHPPSKLDSIIYSTVMETALEHKVIFQKVGVTGFQSLSESPNPVFRLLAIKLMAEFGTDSKKLVEFYANYVNEQDSFILGNVVHQLLKIDTIEATSVIMKIMSSEAIKSQREVAAAISEMIQNHNQRTISP